MMICGWACLPDCCPLSFLSGDDDLWLGCLPDCCPLSLLSGDDDLWLGMSS